MEKKSIDINHVTNKWKNYKKSMISKPTVDPFSSAKPTPRPLKRKDTSLQVHNGEKN